MIARDAGLSLVETQALSVFVFAGSAEVSAVGLFGRGTGGLEIVLTTFLLNVRHVLYGMSLGRVVSMSPRERVVAAYFLTDEAYGVSVARRARSFGFVLGAELSLFVTWNLATFVGALLGGVIPDPVGSASTSSFRSRSSRCSCRCSGGAWTSSSPWSPEPSPGRLRRDCREGCRCSSRVSRGRCSARS